MTPHQLSKGRARVMPKPEVRAAHYLTHPDHGTLYKLTTYHPSLKSVRARKKALEMTWEEKVHRGALAIGRLAHKNAVAETVPGGITIVRKLDAEDLKFYSQYAAAVLAVTEGRG